MNNKNKVDLEHIDLEELKDKVTDLPGLIEYAHGVGSAIVKPEDKGKIKGTAVTAMHEQTDRQFRQLYEQMRTLVEQANYLKKRVNISERIYLADMGFQPVYNQNYYLFQRANGEDVLTMVSPEEWGRSNPFKKFIAQVRLLSDHTWEVVRAEDDFFDY